MRPTKPIHAARRGPGQSARFYPPLVKGVLRAKVPENLGAGGRVFVPTEQTKAAKALEKPWHQQRFRAWQTSLEKQLACNESWRRLYANMREDRTDLQLWEAFERVPGQTFARFFRGLETHRMTVIEPRISHTDVPPGEPVPTVNMRMEEDAVRVQVGNHVEYVSRTWFERTIGGLNHFVFHDPTASLRLVKDHDLERVTSRKNGH